MKTKCSYKNIWFLSIAIVFSIILIFLFVLDRIIANRTSKFIYNHPEQIPYNITGVVLGTSKFTKKGNANPFFYKRIAAAEILYNSGKIKYIILSGDNRHRSYNEPLMMKRELLRRGIPDSVIFLDYAGLRTYDSVIRAWKIFGQKKFTIISQRFHAERALFIAHHEGIDAIAFAADDVDFPDNFMILIREFLARVRMLWDISTNINPTYLGKQIPIP